ncbi:MAG: Bax inhibitor-1 family protein [Fimbriimonadales bacterium]
MYVPNYVPAPIEVPNNVTEERHLVRLGFIRRVSALHFLSLLIVGGLSMLSLPTPLLGASVAELGVVLLLLSVIRISTRATRMDQILSLSLLPLLIVSLAVIVRTLDQAGWPVWGVAVGAASAVVYGLCCGRDFSFVGQFFLSLIVSCTVLAIVATTTGMSPHEAAFLLGANTAYLFYLVYDCASLLARRRLGEEAAAVVDLYRDVFNVFGYLVRVARHWRKHRIWAR